jgi:hypothetical protein
MYFLIGFHTNDAQVGLDFFGKTQAVIGFDEQF